jgi:ParB family chromosome partitioning protein
MAAWWKPTNEGYFQHVPKAAILEAVGEFAPDSRHPAGEVEEGRHCQRSRAAGGWHRLDARHLQGRRHAGCRAGAEEQDAPEDAEAMADEPAEALAA